MQFSLIMATIGRKEEVDAAIKSFKEQTFKDFEVIIVDQNPQNYLTKIIKKYDSLNIKHLRIKKKGLSIARNEGIKKAKGKIISFPDDDCEYEKNTLKEVNSYFNKEKIDILNIKVVDKKSKKVSAGSKLNKKTIINLKNFHEACSVALFFNNNVIKKVGYFDEDMGAGKKYGSGEESDYILRALYDKFKIIFEPKIMIYHPKDFEYVKDISKRSRSYGRGWGYLYRKHLLKYKKNYAIYQYFKYLFGSIILLIINIFLLRKYNIKKYFNIFLGMVQGLK